MTLEAILFDKDGTLFDFRATWVAPYVALFDAVVPDELWAAASEVLGFDPATGGFQSDSILIAATSLDLAETLAPVISRDPGEIVAAMERIAMEARQIPAVPLDACLSALKARHRLGLVTNDAEESARAHLTEAGVLEHFEFVAGYDSGFGAKPEPGQLLAFSDISGLAPERVAMVGDSRHDLAAARAAGMVPVGVLTGMADTAELADLAEVVLPDIGHLEDWLAGRAAAIRP